MGVSFVFLLLGFSLRRRGLERFFLGSYVCVELCVSVLGRACVLIVVSFGLKVFEYGFNCYL